MRKMTVLLFLLSLCALHLVFSAPRSFDHKISSKCCKNTTKARIPLKNIVTYWWTSSDCSTEAIVFKTIRNLTLCVDPSAHWVEKYMKAVDRIRSTSA